MRICILTDDDFFAEQLMLECGAFPVSLCRGKGGEIPAADLYLQDVSYPAPSGVAITFGEGGDFPYAYSARALAKLLSGSVFGTPKAPLLTLYAGRRSALLDGQEVFFSRREFALLSALFEADGFLSREELIEKIWDGKADARTVNVYIHYLREKLEAGGRRIICCDRARGYAIYKEGQYVTADLR